MVSYSYMVPVSLSWTVLVSEPIFHLLYVNFVFKLVDSPIQIA